jgi:hypothetical protein
MSSLYSATLFEAHDLGGGGAFITPPADEYWVIRTATAFIPGGATAGGFQVVEIVNNMTIAYDTYTTEVTGAWRTFNDLRVGMTGGLEYAIFGFGPNDVGLYGYKFKLP